MVDFMCAICIDSLYQADAKYKVFQTGPIYHWSLSHMLLVFLVLPLCRRAGLTANDRSLGRLRGQTGPWRRGRGGEEGGRPRWPQEAPRWPQDGPKMAPRWPREAPRWPQKTPRWPQESPRWPQQAPRRLPVKGPHPFEAHLDPQRGPQSPSSWTLGTPKK